MKLLYTLTVFVLLVSCATAFFFNQRCVVDETTCDNTDTKVCGEWILGKCRLFKNECDMKRANCYKLTPYLTAVATRCEGFTEGRLGFCRRG